jgi:hypothetical protein
MGQAKLRGTKEERVAQAKAQPKTVSVPRRAGKSSAVVTALLGIGMGQLVRSAWVRKYSEEETAKAGGG